MTPATMPPTLEELLSLSMAVSGDAVPPCGVKLAPSLFSLPGCGTVVTAGATVFCGASDVSLDGGGSAVVVDSVLASVVVLTMDSVVEAWVTPGSMVVDVESDC